MLKYQHLLIFAGISIAVLLVGVSGVWWLDESCPIQQGQPDVAKDRGEAANNAEQNSDTDHNPPKNATAFIPISQPGKSPPESQKQGRNTEWQPGNWRYDFLCGAKATDVAIALFTLLLTGFTGLLWFVGSGQLRELRRSVDALVQSERAYVFVKVKLDGSIRNDAGGTRFHIGVHFVNRGKTPAMLMQLRAYHVIEGGAPKALITFQGSERELPQGWVIKADGDWAEEVRCILSKIEMAEIERLEKTLFVVGLIKYEGVHGTTHETGFCWQYRQHGGKRDFVISPDTKLNYRT